MLAQFYKVLRNVIPMIELKELPMYVVAAIYSYVFSENDIPEVVRVRLNQSSFNSVKEIIEDLSLMEWKTIVGEAVRGNLVDEEPGDKINGLTAAIVTNILDVQDGETLIDLGSGEGNFLYEAAMTFLSDENKKRIKLVGCEIDEVKCGISKMAFSILGVEAEIVAKDCLKRAYKLPRFDKGFVFPPFKLKKTKGIKYTSNIYEFSFNGRISPEWFFVDKLIESMHDESKAVALMPLKSMYNSADEHYREFLLKNGYIEAIIELPKEATRFTGTKGVMLVLSKGNKEVRFINATEFVIHEVGFIHFEGIVEEYNSIDDTLHSKNLSIEEVLERNSTTLSPLSIMTEKPVIEDGIKLSDISEFNIGAQYTLKKFKQQGQFSTEKTNHRLLTSTDISEEGIINLNELENYAKNVKKFEKYDIHKGDVIIASKSTKVKVAVIDEEPDGHVIVTGGMLIIRLDTKKIDPRWFKAFLDSEDGRAELDRIQKGSIITTINARDLGNLVIPKVPLDEQKKIGDQLFIINSQIASLQEELDRKKNELKYLYKSKNS